MSVYFCRCPKQSKRDETFRCVTLFDYRVSYRSSNKGHFCATNNALIERPGIHEILLMHGRLELQ